ncbi:MAG: hypothetical protein NC203_03730 [Firmicutes bacterium]|nr:hypothetical protein [[Eubacterium] siraeum]MCM1487457.1 hypothetical protein [Bacillota bacterium]
MELLRSVLAICVQNLRKWKTDYRIWIIGLIGCVTILVFVDDMERIVAGLGTAMPVWIFPFIYSQFHMKLIYTLLLVLLFCNAPFIDGNQTFICMRSGRIKWLLGQVLYVIVSSGIYYLFLMIVGFLSAAFAGGEINLEWGKTLSVVANSDAAGRFGSPFIEISNTVITYFSPINATWFTFLLSWLCGSMIGLIIFLCNILTKTKFLGITVSSALVILSALIENSLNYMTSSMYLPFSPISWTTLNHVDVGGLTQNPSFGYCISFYLIAIALLITGILIFGKKQSMDVKGN